MVRIYLKKRFTKDVLSLKQVDTITSIFSQMSVFSKTKIIHHQPLMISDNKVLALEPDDNAQV